MFSPKRSNPRRFASALFHGLPDPAVVAIGLAAFLGFPPFASVASAVDGEPWDDPRDRAEVVVVTASRTEQPLSDVPASMTVLTEEEIARRPAESFADLLRVTPGVNVSQSSAWDVQISTRNATTILPKGQLVLVDGRSIFQDFNGVVWWSLTPYTPGEIRQIEVVRGPASAVWGANAADGVIHVITKSPAEMAGTTVTLGGGELETVYTSVTHAGVEGRLGYKATAAFFEQAKPYERPTGLIPGTVGPTNPDGTAYPVHENLATRIPKFNARLDWAQDPETTWSVSGGYTGASSGLALVPGGPVDLQSGTFDAFGKIDWKRRNARVSAHVSYLDSPKARFLIGGRLAPLQTETYQLEASDSRLVDGRHTLTYGGNVRLSRYDLAIAPDANDREQFGFFVQDDFWIHDRLRVTAGMRIDDIDPMGTAPSPRAALSVTPVQGHQLRLSFNRAFLAPTAIDNYLDTTNPVVITAPGPGGPLDLSFPLQVRGSTDLREEKVDAFEVAWLARFGRRVDVSVSAYRNELRDAIRNVPVEFYSSSNPPPGWPLDPALLDVPPPMGFAGIPSVLGARNVAEVVNRGIEISVHARPLRGWNVFANYSVQEDPEVKGVAALPLPGGGTHVPFNDPPRHRFHAGAGWEGSRYFADANVSYQSEAFWTDVLNQLFWGPTESFSLVNVGAGVRLASDRAVVSVRALNVFDEKAQQHLWGSIVRRKVTGQVIYKF